MSDESNQSQSDVPIEERQPTLAEKLVQAEKTVGLWSRVALDPALSPEAAHVARNMARSSAAALKLAQKAQQHSESTPNPNPASQVSTIGSDLKTGPNTSIKACSWDGLPAFWTPFEAWALIKGRWEEVNAADVGRNSSLMTSAEFGRTFGSLPPLPNAAFGRASRNSAGPRAMSFSSASPAELAAPGSIDQSMETSRTFSGPSSYLLAAFILAGFAVSAVMALTGDLLPAACLLAATLLSPTASGGAKVVLRTKFTTHTPFSLLFALILGFVSFWLSGFFSLSLSGLSVSGSQWVIIGLTLGFLFAS
ncbi:hypothetical protein L6654_16815 [Bradyrhizobium sp. WYCCWR 13023]|uniref:Uncharacterized protein n=1 Tax=Bradyrhizobium zhengyangense TaxID=2911009 RepID=A0A9X1RB43_9BRAD|nr:hypothetical protein [Bradyrhizobium zhengyangense]MCG2628295.1 hypothetical protein [Bradyrhizobium zhengyangense]